MDSPPKDTDTCGHRAALASPARALPQEPTLTRGIYLEKRSYSLLIWKASSRVWHMTRTVTWEQDSSTQSPTPPQSPGPAQSPAACAHLSADQLHLLQRGQHEHRHLAHAGLGLAQDVHTQDGLGDVLLDCGRKGGSVRGARRPCRQQARVGVGPGAGGLPSDWCSKPQFTRARRTSGFSRKSRKPQLWMDMYEPLTSFLGGAGALSGGTCGSSSPRSPAAHSPRTALPCCCLGK